MDALHDDYAALRSEATRLAGGLRDLAQRATVYHHLFAASGGNHAFPLIASHGALWAGGYFRRALRLGDLLSWQYLASPVRRQAQLQSLADFADAFRDINRRVCIDTYTMFHFTARHGRNPAAAEFVSADLLEPLNRLHDARRERRELPDAEKREIFEAHFLWEQRCVVGPAIAQAIEEFHWPLVKALALRPPVRFAYFPRGVRMWFRNFASREERIANGLRAFDMAAAAGWDFVELALRHYAVLPDAFFVNPRTYFADFATNLLAAPA
jgi:hypothetical protein